MLDVFAFIEERGGNPEAIRESQRRRHAPVEVVDEIIEMYAAARAGRFVCNFFSKKSGNSERHGVKSAWADEVAAARYQVDRKGTEINSTQKEIGAKKKVCAGNQSIWLREILDRCREAMGQLNWEGG